MGGRAVSEAPAAALPGLAEALGWVGSELDDAGSRAVGRVTGAYADAESDLPVWLAIAVSSGGRRLPFARRRAKTIVVSLRECAAMPGRVWTAQARGAVLAAPAVDPTRPLLREHEVAICVHYGIGERVGRHAEVFARAEGSITAQPTSS
jgi:hypothetical protein